MYGRFGDAWSLFSILIKVAWCTFFLFSETETFSIDHPKFFFFKTNKLKIFSTETPKKTKHASKNINLFQFQCFPFVSGSSWIYHICSISDPPFVFLFSLSSDPGYWIGAIPNFRISSFKAAHCLCRHPKVKSKISG